MVYGRGFGLTFLLCRFSFLIQSGIAQGLSDRESPCLAALTWAETEEVRLRLVGRIQEGVVS